MVYKTYFDIVDTLDRAEIRKLVSDAEIKNYPSEPTDKLAKKLFEYWMVNKPEMVDIENLDDNVDTSNPQEVWDELKNEKDLRDGKPVDAIRLEQVAARIRKEAGNVKKGGSNETVTFISKAFNFWENPNGYAVDGQRIRYVMGSKSIYLEEQPSAPARLPSIRFYGVEGTEINFNGYIGRSVLQTRDERLIQYLKTNRNYNGWYIIYDKAEEEKQKLIKDRAVTKLKSWVYNANADDIIAILAYSDIKTGKKTYQQLKSVKDENTLITRAISMIENDYESFLSVMESQTPKMYHLAHKAVEHNILKVSRDGRTIKLVENNLPVCESSLGSDWEADLTSYLLSNKGAGLLSRIQRQLDYYVV